MLQRATSHTLPLYAPRLGSSGISVPRPLFMPSFLKRVSLQPLGSCQLYSPCLADRRTQIQYSSRCLVFLLNWRYELVFSKPPGNYVPGAYLQKCESLQCLLLDLSVFTSRQQSKQGKEAGLLLPGQPAHLDFSPVCLRFSLPASWSRDDNTFHPSKIWRER